MAQYTQATTTTEERGLRGSHRVNNFDHVKTTSLFAAFQDPVTRKELKLTDMREISFLILSYSVYDLSKDNLK